MNQLIKEGFVRDDVNHIRIAMHARILRCPLGGRHTECPFCEVRNLPVADRFEWLDSKSDREVTDLFESHVKCQAENTDAGAA